jgi:hypothetical protein
VGAEISDSHDASEAEKLGTVVYIIEGGRSLHETGNTESGLSWLRRFAGERLVYEFPRIPGWRCKLCWELNVEQKCRRGLYSLAGVPVAP